MTISFKGTLRKALQSDVSDLAKLFVVARQTAMPWLPNLHSHEADLAFFRNQILPKQDVVVAELDGEIAGFIAFKDDWVNQLYIHPRSWRSGAGSALLGCALEGAVFRQLWVFEKNCAAQKFYAQHGFKVVERTDGSNNEERCPDLRMEWRA